MQALLDDWINGLSHDEYLFLTLALFSLLLILAYRIYRLRQSSRFISDTATSRVASAAQGYVELKGVGELIPGSTITSPFSQGLCLWYHCKIELKKNDGKRSYWVEQSSELSAEPFILRDDSGDCFIEPDGAQVIPAQTRVWYGSNLQARHQTPLSGRGLISFVGSGDYRFTEKLIAVEDSIYVIGDFVTERKTVDALNPEQMIDQQRLGKQTVREQGIAVQAVVQRQLMTKPRERNHPYIISALPEDKLLRQKRIYLILYLMLFFALFYLFVLMLNHPQ